MRVCYSEIDNPGDDDGYQYPGPDGAPPQLSLFPEISAQQLLPEATPLQHLAMDEFVKAPSRDRWLELVESMRREREGHSIEFYSESESGDTSSGLVDVNGSPSRHPSTKGRRIPVVRPDPPTETEENNDMGGWTMRANRSGNDEDEEVSEQLKSMLNNPHAYAYAHPHCREDTATPTHRSSMEIEGTSQRSGISQRSTIGIFLLGFVIGTIVIVGLSFSFDRTPSQELRMVGFGFRGIGTNSSDTEYDEGEGPENLITIADFCGKCNGRTSHSIVLRGSNGK
mmetsp:Transcript_16397/g.35449  ORF Transcript_16397/g.35449 Transcript_16397/m.35449 type:complete len:283 (+) Transcript_16397:71-919(+)